MITCWNCGQRITDIHQLTDVRLIGICLFGRCFKCGVDVACRDLIKVKQVIDLTGRNNDRGRKNNGSEIYDLDIGNTRTGIQGRNPEQKQDPGMGGQEMDFPERLVFGGIVGPSNFRKRIPEMAGRDQTQKERNGT